MCRIGRFRALPILLAAATIAVLSACSGASDPQPLADSTMVEVLIELHLANGRIEVTDEPLTVSRDSILRAYGVDRSTYADAVAYYADHPDAYSRVYGEVLDRLSAERTPPADLPNRLDTLDATGI